MNLINIIKNNLIIQNLASTIISLIPPYLHFTLAKYSAIKKAFLITAQDDTRGSYLEFGVFTGSTFNHAMKETEEYGFEKVRAEQWELGANVRALLVSKGFRSVAAEGFQAPGVVVSYTDNANIQNGKMFAELGMQIAAGVPLKCDEPKDFQTFRLGLFGLDKLHNIDRTVANLENVLNQIINSGMN